MARNLAIMIFDNVEVLDFAGPFEVFAVARDPQDSNTTLFNVYTIAENMGPIIARNGLSINPNYTLDDCPAPDIFLIPGGRGTREAIRNARIIDWITARAADAELVLSVCTGAFLLAKAGLLGGLRATTYHTEFDMLQDLEPAVTLCPGERYVDNGRIITSAGVSAGIDMALYVVSKLHGVEQSIRTAQRMEYDHWQPVEK